ncbi:GNAT family N-acetyltransferase [Paenibacillus mendelii]|uniref:GNAT family N-acetyltransferase n=1 Tax=Paenibacillus mendelii TaxID=206163 RepID=A0ABV6JFU7_9BACL|nr:GNAT family N-acetyltransferase [Paenibacillus mendelii]MCQ6557666.1 GNAT family N-acetyltransferase [Paenibacillus mendelii]
MYIYRLAERKDLTEIVELSRKWAEEDITVGYENVQWSEEKLLNRLNEYFYVVAAEGRIVGYSFGEVRSGNAGQIIPPDESYLEIFEVYIHPDHRSEGMGKKLVGHLMEQAEKNQVTRLLVGSSNRRWKETAKFYEELGFSMWYFQMFK